MRSIITKITSLPLLHKNYSNFANVSLSFDKANKAAYISLSNQKKRNPLSLETIKELQQKLNQVDRSILQDQIKILILKGQGPVFSAGHDLKQIKASKEPQKIFQQCTKALMQIKDLSIPSLCVVNGVVAAGGFQLALSCDLIIASEKSTFSTPGVKWGLFCSTPGVQLVRSINSEKKGNEMLLFGESITAQQAYQYGLVNKVVAAQSLDNEVNSYIKKANNLSSEVIALGKQVLRSQKELELKDAYCVAIEGMKTNILEKADCQEGLTAFAEKRHPHFTK